jgi:hypothetical protein
MSREIEQLANTNDVVLLFTVTVGAGEHAVQYQAPLAATADALIAALPDIAVCENEGFDEVLAAPSDWSDMSLTTTSEAALASAWLIAGVDGLVVELLLHAARPRAAAASAGRSKALRVREDMCLASVRGCVNRVFERTAERTAPPGGR